jgi:hypothetical protein
MTRPWAARVLLSIGSYTKQLSAARRRGGGCFAPRGDAKEKNQKRNRCLLSRAPAGQGCCDDTVERLEEAPRGGEAGQARACVG